MLPKKERLSRLEFNRFFSVGKRLHSSSLQIIYTPYNSLHVSVVISKKIAKSAVIRNKIRRRIYDIVKNYRSEHGVKGVFIFMVKKPVVDMSYATLKEETLSILNSAVKKIN